MKKRIFSALIAFLFLLLLAACSPTNIAAPTSAPVQELTQTVAPTVTPTPTTAPSPTPTTVPTPATDEFGFSEERRAELNQQIQDFLNKEGDFTEEKLSEKIIKITLKTNKFETKLGLMDETPRLQCWLFDYFERDGKLLLLTGFDGKNDTRFVTLLYIPIDVYAVSEPRRFIFTDLMGNSFNASDVVIDGSGDPDKIRENIEKVIGGRMIFTLLYEKLSQEVIDASEKISKETADLGKEMNDKMDLNKSLMMNVASNGIDLGLKNFDKTSLLYVDSLSDISNIDFTKVPILTIDIIF